MKKWIMLLICALLCAFTFGALAETVSLGQYTLQIPDKFEKDEPTDEDLEDGVTAVYFLEEPEVELYFYLEEDADPADFKDEFADTSEYTATGDTTINGIACIYAQYADTDDDGTTYYGTMYAFPSGKDTYFVEIVYADQAGNQIGVDLMNTLK